MGEDVRGESGSCYGNRFRQGDLACLGLTAGETSPTVLAGLAQSRLRAKTEQLRATFQGNFTIHHGTFTRAHLDRIDLLDEHIEKLTDLIDSLITERELAWVRELVATRPESAPPVR